MSREPEYPGFGRTRAQTARAAVLLFLLGSGAVALLTQMLTRPGTPLGELFRTVHLTPPLLFGVGLAVVLAVSWTGYTQSMRAAEQFRIAPEGLEVTGPYGRYLVRWENIAQMETTGGGSLKLQLKSRAALLETHQGTDEQRERLKSMTPYDDWDLLFTRADLGSPVGQVRDWIAAHMAGPDGRAAVGDGR